MNRSYVTQPGDTWFRIAAKHGVNLTALLAANPQAEAEAGPIPGLLIDVPEPSERWAVVLEGESFEVVCENFNLSGEEVLAANPDLDPGQIFEGMRIRLPPARHLRLIRPYGPYGYPEMTADLQELKRRYPWLRSESIGTSVLGRPIPAVRLGDGPVQLHYNGAFHANEWITAALLIRFIEQTAESLEHSRRLRGADLQDIFSKVSLWIVPMVNPDGVELVHAGLYPRHPYAAELPVWNEGSHNFHNWKANIRGVDLNDQFPACWEEEAARRGRAGPGARDYPGERPLSEPEAQAMAAFAERMDFAWVMALHTQGEEIYWNYRDFEPPEAEPLARRLAAAGGYRPVKLAGSDAGYKDWFIQTFRRPGFTIEAGIGVNPLPVEHFPQVYEQVSAILLEGLKAAAE